MKNLAALILILLLPALGYSQAACFRPTSPIELGVLVFKSFQEQNYDRFLDCFFTEAACDSLIEQADISDSLKIIYAKKYIERANFYRKDSKENFEWIIAEGLKKGIVWNKIELISVRYDGPKTENNIQTADVGIECIYEDIYFGFLMEDCHKGDFWLIINEVEIRFVE